MTSPSFSEEKLTAYALGELSPAERREVEAELAAHPALQAELAAIQSLAAQLREDLSMEIPELKSEDRLDPDLEKPAPQIRPDDDKIIAFRRNPWLYATGLLAAAACAALLLLPTLSTSFHRSASSGPALKEDSPVVILEEVDGVPAPAEPEAMPEQMVAMADKPAEMPAQPAVLEKAQSALASMDRAEKLEVVEENFGDQNLVASSAMPSAPGSPPVPPAAPAPASQTAVVGGSGAGWGSVSAKKSTPLGAAMRDESGGKSDYVMQAGSVAANASALGGDLPARGALFASENKSLQRTEKDLQSNEASLAELQSDYKARQERFSKLKAMPSAELERSLPVTGLPPAEISTAAESLQKEQVTLAELKKEYRDNNAPQVAASEARIRNLQDQLDKSVEGIRKGFAADLEASKARLEAKEREVARMKEYFRRMKTAPAAGESYLPITDNAFLRVPDQPLSTFSIDVDTASYANVRRFLGQNQLPPPDSVRIEELVNYFPYNYPQPKNDDPFSVTTEVAHAPWKEDHLLVRIGLQGKTVAIKDRPPANLVFLIDVSGSMSDSNKLPLVISSMKLLVEKLKPEDRVAITVYAGGTGLVLPSTPVSQRGEIIEALSNLSAGGSTNGALGIQLAYEIAKANFIKDGINRVILCTDGDFNVGVTNRGDLIKLIGEKAKSKVFLSIFGFGMGNLQDATLEQLANKGNGNYGYIDNPKEAKRVFVDQVSGTLQTIAKDVKIQVEFNPAVVGSYRLIGYENRMLAARDFNDDKKDAGEIGAGHRVTALYELIPVGVKNDQPSIDPLKYQKPAPVEYAGDKSEIMNVKLRYKQPEGDVSKLLENPVPNKNILSFAPKKTGWFGSAPAEVSPDFQFAAGVAAFGMILRDSPYKGGANLDLVLRLAGKGTAKQEDRTEFIGLVKKTKTLLNEDGKPQSKE